MKKFLLFAFCSFIVFQSEATERIIGGYKVEGTDHPWQLSLKSKMGTHFCGAVLIDQQVAITAAHCVWSDSPGDFSVHGGSTKGTLSDLYSIGTVAEIVVHPLFDRQNFTAHDIAILFLKSKVKITSALQPIKVVDTQMNLNLEDEFHTLTTHTFQTSGWGVVSPPNMIESPSPDLMATQQRPLASSNVSLFFESIKKYLLDTYDLDEKTLARISGFDARTLLMEGNGGLAGSCSGDSGGPLVMDVNSVQLLIGLSSYTAGGVKRCLGVSVYTNLQAYKAWIDEEIAKH